MSSLGFIRLASWLHVILSIYVGSAVALQPLPPPVEAPGNEQPDVLPEVRYSDLAKSIFITKELAERKDSEGLSLIPPSGQQFAETFRDDLASLTNEAWSLQVVDTLDTNASGILLGLSEEDRDAFVYANGVPTEEGYDLRLEAGRAIVYGSGARGAFWGTRTLLQYFIMTNWTEPLPGQNLRDVPDYATRGYMLDAGRKWYSPSFLKDLCTYASFFKMSEFHYHTSDNYPLNRGHNETWNKVYAQFSLHPESEELAGLVQRANETLSRADFEDLQQHCAQRGITVIPEIEAPGHCLSITKWKPELALATKDLLNLTHPDSIPTVKQIWTEFLPWFQTREVHIGADEYDATLADDYIRFVNEMSAFVNETSGGSKKIRIWGTDEPSPTNLTISTDVVVQHWQFGQSDPLQLQETGYQLVNSQDYWAYMSLKNDHMPINPAPYPQFFNVDRIIPPGDSSSSSWQWQPSFFNASAANVTEVLAADASGNKGAILAAWNDNGPDATTQLEAYYAMRRGIPLIAARAWSGGVLLDDTDALNYWADRAPGQNLDRRTNFTSWAGDGDSTAGNATVVLGGGSKGMNYTLTLAVTGPFVLSSADTSLSLVPVSPASNSSNSSNSSSAATEYELIFEADGWPYPLRSVSESDGFDPGLPGRIWANATSSTHAPVRIAAASLPLTLTLTGDPVGGARAWLGAAFAGRFEVFVFGGRNTLFSWSQMALVAPLDTLEGGGVAGVELRDGVWPPDASTGAGGGDGGGGASASATGAGTGSSAVPTSAAAATMRVGEMLVGYVAVGIMSVASCLLWQ